MGRSKIKKGKVSTNESNANTENLSVLSQGEIEDLEKNVRFYKTRLGTQLAFHEYGNPKGYPVIFFHGTGSHEKGKGQVLISD